MHIHMHTYIFTLKTYITIYVTPLRFYIQRLSRYIKNNIFLFNFPFLRLYLGGKESGRYIYIFFYLNYFIAFPFF